MTKQQELENFAATLRTTRTWARVDDERNCVFVGAILSDGSHEQPSGYFRVDELGRPYFTPRP